MVAAGEWLADHGTQPLRHSLDRCAARRSRDLRKAMAYAHSVRGKSRDRWETLESHSRRVADGVQVRLAHLQLDELAKTMGLLHDLGKIKNRFQRKLAGERNDVTHSGEGARILFEQGYFGKALAGIIAGHHGRLPDPDCLKSRVQAAEKIDLPEWCDLPPLAIPERVCADPDLAAFRLQFLVRMLYGALCDADDRETASFYDEVEGRTAVDRPTAITGTMLHAFEAYMTNMAGDGPVNELRRRILAHAQTIARADPGLFTLTVPTGGGKTLTSLGFGLVHALSHRLRRLIIVVPYTSIIEQTADVYRAVLGHDAVLEHHSNADWSGEDESEAEQRKVMGASWDVPVVVTTAVQFFESLYAARKKRCRKLPSLAHSVIVLDEAQTMPLALLRPCLAGLRELMDGYGASVVLSTATQPALTTAGGFPAPEALEGGREIAPDPPALFRALKRVEVRDVGEMDDANVADRMREADQVLSIVDNRQQARTVFEAIRDAPGAAHLSTLMVPAHRRAVLKDVRKRLEDKRPVRLISTSLIEAGVDVDFPLVLRSAAGIDSVAQAAGRCNREGRLDDPGRVEVFWSEHPAPDAVEQFAAIGRGVLAEEHDDPIGEGAVASYFKNLWDTYGAEALDAAKVGPAEINGILNAIGKAGPECPFEQIEQAFCMIPDGERTVIVLDGNWGMSWDRLEHLRFGSAGVVAKAIQSHAVNVPWKMWNTLLNEGHIAWWAQDQFDDQFAVLQTSNLYDEQAGLGEEGFGQAIV